MTKITGMATRSRLRQTRLSGRAGTGTAVMAVLLGPQLADQRVPPQRADRLLIIVDHDDQRGAGVEHHVHGVVDRT